MPGSIPSRQPPSPTIEQLRTRQMEAMNAWLETQRLPETVPDRAAQVDAADVARSQARDKLRAAETVFRNNREALIAARQQESFVPGKPKKDPKVVELELVRIPLDELVAYLPQAERSAAQKLLEEGLPPSGGAPPGTKK